jgi:hypothetical protein
VNHKNAGNRHPRKSRLPEKLEVIYEYVPGPESEAAVEKARMLFEAQLPWNHGKRPEPGGPKSGRQQELPL